MPVNAIEIRSRLTSIDVYSTGALWPSTLTRGGLTSRCRNPDSVSFHVKRSSIASVAETGGSRPRDVSRGTESRLTDAAIKSTASGCFIVPYSFHAVAHSFRHPRICNKAVAPTSCDASPLDSHSPIPRAPDLVRNIVGHSEDSRDAALLCSDSPDRSKLQTQCCRVGIQRAE